MSSPNMMLVSIRQSDYEFIMQQPNPEEFLLTDTTIVRRISLKDGVKEQPTYSEKNALIWNTHDECVMIGEDPNGEQWIATYIP